MNIRVALLICFVSMTVGVQSYSVTVVAQNSLLQHIGGCPKLAPRTTPPKNVRDLRPDDIDVVMAIGDSITAGFGITGHYLEDRGLSFTAGGDINATTLPNIFSYFRQPGSSLLVGPSLGNHTPDKCIDPYCFGAVQNLIYDQNEKNDVFNVAVSGARHDDLPTIEVPQLVSGVMNSFNNASLLSTVQDKWKFVSLMIGANDVCHVGGDWDSSDPNHEIGNFTMHIQEVIENIRANAPKTIVNLVHLLDVTQVYSINCEQVPWYEYIPFCVLAFTHIECPILFKGETNRTNVANLIAAYNAALDDIANSYSNNGTFAVITSPALANSKFNEAYLSTFDRFHPNAMAHEYMSIALWNNLFEPKGSKTTAIQDFSTLKPYCPTDSDRIVV